MPKIFTGIKKKFFTKCIINIIKDLIKTKLNKGKTISEITVKIK